MPLIADEQEMNTALQLAAQRPFEGTADMPGMRFDGQRWVDETRPDRPRLVVLAKDLPEQWSDLVAARTPYRPNESRKPRSKSRRRGGF